jgi:hypothetical protein
MKTNPAPTPIIVKTKTISIGLGRIPVKNGWARKKEIIENYCCNLSEVGYKHGHG